MKRFVSIVILAILAIVAAPVGAQTYPDYFNGDMLNIGTYAVEIEPYNAINCPISLPPGGNFYYPAIIVSTGPSINVTIECAAIRGQGCVAGPPVGWGATGEFVWQHSVGSYARSWVVPGFNDKVWFDAWTFAPGIGQHSGGCLGAQPHCCPWYDFVPECTVWISRVIFDPSYTPFLLPEWAESEW